MAILPFQWYGGKFTHLDWLLPLLPEADVFVDVFGGSGAVLLNRKPAPLEVFNDVDRDLIAFFRVLRDNPEPLLQAIRLTPWSREEHRIACTLEDEISDLERARRFFVRCGQTIGGQGHLRRPSSWSRTVNPATLRVQRTTTWGNHPDRLARVAERLLGVEVECCSAVDLITTHGSYPDTLFYCDPPYAHVLRGDVHCYGENEMSDDDHVALAEVLSSIKGRAAVSGYRCSLYDEIYAGWHRTDDIAKVPSSARHGVHRKVIRQECLWTNYDPSEATVQATLFAS